MTDIEIARNTKLYDIKKIAKNLGINNEYLETYGKYKAKIDNSIFNSDINKNGKLILVTAINPTPLGEGKTTMSIAIADGLRRIGKNSILALREPSLGPVFGIKGGATGGGKVQIAPMEDINLHFTGDIHALTSANNLLSALIDNHIYFGNELGFDKVVWKRCLDLNDRQLRSVETGLSKEKNIVPRLDNFDITVASEMMAILCLAKDINDLKRRISNIIVGYTKDDKPIYCKDLKAEGSLTVLLKDAIKPNLVQTLEHTPAIVHGGPFANIAHGCNSVIATNLAMRLSDYVVTEAGFGADLGAEKFLDIKCRSVKHPDAVVLVATLKALKYHGGAKIEDCKSEDIASLDKGIDNLYKHVDNLRNKFGLNVIVAINKYNEDSKIEINYLRNKLEEQGIELSLVEGYKKGGKGAIDIANKLVDIVENRCKFKFVYDLDDSIYDKVNKVCKEIYGASNVIFSDSAKESIKRIEKLKLDKVPVCIAKTQYSLSDNPKNLLCDRSYDITIRDVELKNGAGFVVCKAGTIMTMPGLPKVPAANSIDIDENNNIVGIF
ncbi:MAG: formate--tetrahydrofolate ligase [bacterium]|nr:formate--tetrahydrofolate ligase [bacterium]MDY4108776.1 formate--tetrahydrofolate ligase [Bacilli bacterium]